MYFGIVFLVDFENKLYVYFNCEIRYVPVNDYYKIHFLFFYYYSIITVTNSL